MADFEEMVGRTDADLWQRAVTELSDVVCQLVSNSVHLYTIRAEACAFKNDIYPCCA